MQEKVDMNGLAEENKLYYMRAHHYSPELKRFVNADSKKDTISSSPTLSLYAYTVGSPITLVDPRKNYLPDDKFQNYKV